MNAVIQLRRLQRLKTRNNVIYLVRAAATIIYNVKRTGLTAYLSKSFNN